MKQLLREKLTECGWRDEVKQRCRGGRAAAAAPAEAAAVKSSRAAPAAP